jgi:exopolyphosphatase/guanosine-5'-triphosphate,3'-diphosphate pyrophosphatase
MITSPRAVIDIGSNAIRLVVYGGPPRAPMPIYNEKARIALGESVDRTGEIEPKIMKSAIAALVRLESLTKAMQVGELRVIATEATRRAKNGAEFLEKAAAAGVPVDLISGQAEALASALGVVCDTPWATGYVADQGGGSLELAQIVDGEPRQPISMPFGTIPLSNRRGLSSKALAHDIEAALSANGNFEVQKGLPLHLVGGAWRTLGRLHMQVTNYPLSILSNYTMPIDATIELAQAVGNQEAMEKSGVVAEGRIPFMPSSLLTAEALVRVLKPSELVVSVYGLREGLLYDRLSQDARSEDPLIAAARHEGARLSRFAYHGDRIAEWITTLFHDDPPKLKRLRHAVCLLADSTWNSHPEYRAENALELALQGNWPGVTAADRALIASGLFAAYGGKRPLPLLVTQLASAELLDRANQWGLAVRLAQRLDGGTGIALSGVALVKKHQEPVLEYEPEMAHLDSATVRKRLKHLSEAFFSG